MAKPKHRREVSEILAQAEDILVMKRRRGFYAVMKEESGLKNSISIMMMTVSPVVTNENTAVDEKY